MAFQSGIVVIGGALIATPLGAINNNELNLTILEWILVILLFVISVLSNFGKILVVLKDFRDLIKSKNVNLKKWIDSLELTEFIVDRFNYTFFAPKIWDRQDPANNDGYTLINPKNKNVRVLVWGSYFTSKMLEEIGYDENANNTVTVIQSTFSGLNAYEYIDDSIGVNLIKVDIEGTRKIIQFKRDKSKIRALFFITEHNGRKITIQCECPKQLYDLYEDLFYKIGKSIKIFG